ncbi:MAG TPA: ATP-binding protein [Dissulfurispiraceae bacterium]|nr:ATP-binding protein [Dissulfurispiraceae bacterium]
MGAQRNRSARTAISLLIILAAATAATIFSSLLTYRNALSSAEDALRLQALGIATSLEASLRRSDFAKETLLSDIISEGIWEGIAFLALYDRDGRIALHSNARLVGRKVEDARIQEAFARGTPQHYYLMLGTDERGFILDAPVHLRAADYLLRLALHPYPAENSIRQARVQLGISVGMVVVLWGIGLILMRAQQRAEKLQRTIDERERFAVLGEMAAVLAHEIRNPLGSIKGFAQYLVEQQQNSGSPASRQPLDIIVAETRRLETLTEDLLVYARPAGVKISRFDLCELIETCVASLPKRPAIACDTDCASPLLITSDSDKLRQILFNLLQNASDAIELEGTVTVAAAAERDKIVLRVSDTGSGMDAEASQKAFDPFYTTKTRGTGLGLAIVGRLVEVLGGTVSIETAAGKGTTFTISLPASLPEK